MALRRSKCISTAPVFAIIAGFAVSFFAGCYMGNQLSLTSQQQEQKVEVRPVASTTDTIGSGRTDGWHSIDVFYGDSKHLNETLRKDQVWFSQVNQDQVINALFRGKRSGYFVDLAANDATRLSNTYSLEQQLGWTGLCIEPNPIYWSNLSYRDCQVVAAVVGKNRMDEVHFRFDREEVGGIVGVGFDNPPFFKNFSTPRYTVTLLEIFERYNVPSHIDYLSLDVEGAEEFVMSTFPIDMYNISVMTVERPKPGLWDLLAKHGYEHIMKLSGWGETLWAHQAVIPSLDIEAVKVYGV